MICVQVPATSANCCVGFDCLGMALDWHGKFYFEPAASLQIEGCPEEYQNEDNLVYSSFAWVCRKFHKEVPPMRIVIDTDIPYARGLGSSSCCVAAGILAADAWLDLKLDGDQKLLLATELEGHPDNVAPALFGQMTACFMEPDSIARVSFDCDAFYYLAIIPDYEVSTPKARKVLPASLDFKQAVSQVGHALVFEKAMEQGNQPLLLACCQDVLHEPYRKALIEQYEDIKAQSSRLQMPMWISGSGPTMLVLSRQKEELEAFKSDLIKRYPSFRFEILRADTKGAQVWYE